MSLRELSGEQLRRVLLSGSVHGKPCTTLEALYALSVREFIHHYHFTWNGREYRTGTSFIDDMSTEAWLAFLRRAFGEDAVAPFVLASQSEDTRIVVKNPALLRLYLNFGFLRDVENAPRMQTAREYLELGLKQCVRRVVLRPAGKRETRFFTLLDAEAGQGQNNETFLKVLVRAFGKDEVKRELRGIPRYRVLIAALGDED